MRAWTILLAAGSGTRLAAVTDGIAKQFLFWKGVPLYWHSARLFSRCARLAGLVFVFPPAHVEKEQKRLAELDAQEPMGLPWRVVSGGVLRQDSVRHGLEALPVETALCPDWVLIHDTARPFASPVLVNRVLDGLKDGACGVIPGIPVTDTIKILADGHVASTPERSLLRAVQTPQGFRLDTLLAAHGRAQDQDWTVTDDAALLELCGQPVLVVDGEPGNAKITHPEDISMLEHHSESGSPRSAFGYDVHRYVPADSPKARPLRLGGVGIPSAPHVQAHSDGDVLLHALADALLGCCAEGDIGRLFPDTDPACAGLNSAVIVEEALTRLHQHGLRLAFADLTIIAQIPKVAPHWMEIRSNVARLLRLDQNCVSLKATTEEGLGFTGAKEGIKAVALVSVTEDAAFRQTRPAPCGA